MNTKAWPGLFRLSLTVLLLQFSQTLSAGGLYISELASPASVGTAGVLNVVNNVEASSAYTNPAGMTGLKEDQTMIGLQLAIPETRFDSSIATGGGSDGGNAGEVAGIPGFFWVKGMTDKWKLGFSAVAPIGGGVDYGDDFVGRYQLYWGAAEPITHFLLAREYTNEQQAAALARFVTNFHWGLHAWAIYAVTGLVMTGWL